MGRACTAEALPKVRLCRANDMTRQVGHVRSLRATVERLL